MKKIVIVIVVVIIICVFGEYVRENIKAGETAANMSLDSTNTIITGVWDDANLSHYKHLAIPDINIKVVNGGLMYAEYAKVTEIGQGAFQGNIWIESVFIPVNIIKVGKNAFYGCSSLTSISYSGTEAQWKEIIFESGNEVLKSLPIKYNAEMPRTKDY